jgi:hypothetical protein
MTAADSGSAGRESGSESAPAGKDDVRRKFREALDRKRGRSGGQTSATGEQEGHPTSGPPAPHGRETPLPRTFRRKSGP